VDPFGQVHVEDVVGQDSTVLSGHSDPSEQLQWGITGQEADVPSGQTVPPEQAHPVKSLHIEARPEGHCVLSAHKHGGQDVSPPSGHMLPSPQTHSGVCDFTVCVLINKNKKIKLQRRREGEVIADRETDIIWHRNYI
jgi:hypothetical protein